MRKTILTILLVLTAMFSLSANEKLNKVVTAFAEQENDPVEVLISKEVETFNGVETFAIIQLTECDTKFYALVNIYGQQNVDLYNCDEEIEAAIELYESNLFTDKYKITKFHTDVHDGTIYKMYNVTN